MLRGLIGNASLVRNVCGCLLLVGVATTVHAGASGVLLSVGAEMEAEGDQAAACHNQSATRCGGVQLETLPSPT